VEIDLSFNIEDWLGIYRKGLIFIHKSTAVSYNEELYHPRAIRPLPIFDSPFWQQDRRAPYSRRQNLEICSENLFDFLDLGSCRRLRGLLRSSGGLTLALQRGHFVIVILAALGAVIRHVSHVWQASHTLGGAEL